MVFDIAENFSISPMEVESWDFEYFKKVVKHFSKRPFLRDQQALISAQQTYILNMAISGGKSSLKPEDCLFTLSNSKDNNDDEGLDDDEKLALQMKNISIKRKDLFKDGQ